MGTFVTSLSRSAFKRDNNVTAGQFEARSQIPVLEYLFETDNDELDSDSIFYPIESLRGDDVGSGHCHYGVQDGSMYRGV